MKDIMKTLLSFAFVLICLSSLNPSNCQLLKDTIFGYKVCRPEVIVQFPDKTWMAIEKSVSINDTRSQAHVSQWIHWKNSFTPFLFMNPERLPRVIDFFPDITSEVITSGYRRENTLILTTEFHEPGEKDSENHDYVFEYEITSGPGFFTLLNKTSTFDYFPHLKLLQKDNQWIFHRILASSFVRGSQSEDDRIIVRSWHANKEPYDPNVIVEARLHPDRSVDTLSRLPSNGKSTDLITDHHLDSLTFLEEEEEEEESDSQTESFLISSNGFWERAKIEKDVTFLAFPTESLPEARNKIRLSNSFFGCPESPCFRGDIDAITDSSKGVIIFKNQYYWTLPSLGPNSELSAPRLIASNWRSFVGFLDAAVNIVIGKERRLLFFRGNKVYFCQETGSCYTTFFVSYMFPGMTTVDAAFADDDTNQLYLIKDTEVTIYESVVEGMPAKLSASSQPVTNLWKTFPETIDDAYRSNNGTIYFFSQGFFLDSNEPGAPRLLPFNLYQCDNNAFSTEEGWKLLSVKNRYDFEMMRNQKRPKPLMYLVSEEESSIEEDSSFGVLTWLAIVVISFLIFLSLCFLNHKHQEKRKRQDDMTNIMLEDNRYA